MQIASAHECSHVTSTWPLGGECPGWRVKSMIWFRKIVRSREQECRKCRRTLLLERYLSFIDQLPPLWWRSGVWLAAAGGLTAGIGDHEGSAICRRIIRCTVHTDMCWHYFIFISFGISLPSPLPLWIIANTTTLFFTIILIILLYLRSHHSHLWLNHSWRTVSYSDIVRYTRPLEVWGPKELLEVSSKMSNPAEEEASKTSAKRLAEPRNDEKSGRLRPEPDRNCFKKWAQCYIILTRRLLHLTLPKHSIDWQEGLKIE